MNLVKIIDLKIIYFAFMHGFWWFRFFGTSYGLYFHDSRIKGIPFSERMGIKKTFHVGSWRIWGLKP